VNNIVLTGMPGAGKSTIGVLLAKVLGYKFIDADLLIQDKWGMLLREIIAKYGEEEFLKIENDVNKEIHDERAVIATGGSAIYCREAMEKYMNEDTVVYIKLPYEEIESRLGNIRRRGVVLKEGQTLMDLYKERTVLYEEFSHIRVNASGLGVEELMDSIAGMIMIHEKF
jgi:shikimate kinase